ncbi:hypothetical protein GCM10022403_079530 [Streptomyces coacervatus]|uniref:Uncharacterized protein n=1 Tax=Streptomyces coacervatus TaxID=647381 RepID=A0ABP7J5Z8_9ACTN
MVNFSLQFAVLAFSVIWCLTLKSAVPSTTGSPSTILITSTWTASHSHSLYRLIVILLMVQVAAAATPAVAALAWACGEPTVTRNCALPVCSATADGVPAVASTPTATAPVVNSVLNFKWYRRCWSKRRGHRRQLRRSPAALTSSKHSPHTGRTPF